jgi:hypothetical protein
MKVRVAITILIFLFLPLFIFSKVQAQSPVISEEILDYRSTIYIRQNGSLGVTEQITVNAQGLQIKHGIYRDFPTKYSSSLIQGTTTKGFRVISITKNGQNEPYKTQSISNGVRVYIGDSNTLLTPGVYVYNLSFETTDQLGFFNKYDELYWNVTGNGWSFPIEHSSVEIHIPAIVQTSDISTIGYIGPQGSTEQTEGFKITQTQQDTVVTAQNTHIQYPSEGFTVVVNWPKGIIKRVNSTY